MNAVWILVEQYQGLLRPVSFELLSQGRKLADTLKVPLVSVLIGNGTGDGELNSLIYHGADEVIAVQDESLSSFVCETYANILIHLINTWKPVIILAAASSSGRTLMPYVAVKVHAGLTADCIEFDIEKGTDNLLQTRPAIGGNIIATIKTPNRRPQMATVRPKSSVPLARDENRRGTIHRIPLDRAFIDSRVEIFGYRKDAGDFVNLEEADVIVAGGMGLKKGDNFLMIKKLAALLGGLVGATREAVDRGWIGYPHQIGLGGKTISPKLYIGVGISGSVQHLAGIKTSETIVSINSDPNAPLHGIADFGIVGDAFEVVPALQKKLMQRRMEGN